MREDKKRSQKSLPFEQKSKMGVLFYMKNTVNINDINYTLSELEKHLWLLLLNGTLRPKDDFHVAAFGSIDTDGLPDLRTVVVRKALPTEKQIWLHTDIRAAKIEQIKNNPSVSWLFYDNKKRIQIRLKATATIHANDEISEKQWSKTPTKSRRSYITLAAPGSPNDEPTSGLNPTFEARDPTPEESEIGQPNFAVVITQIEALEWLFLHHSGHRRAIFRYNTEGVVLSSSWLIP